MTELRARIEHAWQTRLEAPERVIEITQVTLREAQSTRNVPAYAASLCTQAYALALMSRCDEAARMAARALEIFETLGDVEGQARSLLALASVHLNMDDYGDTLKAGLHALSTYEHLLPDLDRGDVYNTIGVAYAYLEDWDKAISFFEQALAQARQHGRPIDELDTYNNIGYTLFIQGRLAEALEYCERALTLARAQQGTYVLAYILQSVGDIRFALGDLDLALACFSEGLALSRVLQNNNYACSNLRGLAQVYQKRGDLDTALINLQEALRLAGQQASARELSLVHEQLSALYEQRGEMERALEHHRLFFQIQKRVLSIRADQRLKGLQVLHDLELARIEAESERQQNRILQQQVAQHEQHIRDLDAYAHTVAHDLRNPLSIVTGVSEMLAEELGPHLDDLYREQVELIRQSGAKMEQIVEELLLLSTQQREDDTQQVVEMARVFEEARKRLSVIIANYEVEVRVATALPPALGNAAWLEEVWVNFLSNAIKYGGLPPRIEVGATLEEDQVRYWVRDNGDGIKPALQGKLFKEGVRLHVREEGYGLGLAIVRRIVERLGGQVGVESTGRPGKGATFWFTLHAVDDREATAPASAPPPAS